MLDQTPCCVTCDRYMRPLTYRYGIGWLCSSCAASTHEHTVVTTTSRDVDCRICGHGINPVFGITAHYDCAAGRRSRTEHR